MSLYILCNMEIDHSRTESIYNMLGDLDKESRDKLVPSSQWASANIDNPFFGCGEFRLGGFKELNEYTGFGGTALKNVNGLFWS